METAYNFVINDRTIVTIGIKPNRPETGYGYIKLSNKKINLNKMDIVKVEKFVEKPNIENAKKYIEEGNYLWNAGMFVFNSDYMLEELKINYEEGYKLLKNLPAISSKEYKIQLKQNYNKCEAISIDYAVMEKSNNIHVIPSDFGWDDIGTWKALQRYIEPDEDANIIKGKVRAYNSSNNVVYAGDKKILLLDIDDIFIIESDEMIVVGKKENIAKVHELRNTINE